MNLSFSVLRLAGPTMTNSKNEYMDYRSEPTDSRLSDTGEARR